MFLRLNRKVTPSWCLSPCWPHWYRSRRVLSTPQGHLGFLSAQEKLVASTAGQGDGAASCVWPLGRLCVVSAVCEVSRVTRDRH